MESAMLGEMKSMNLSVGNEENWVAEVPLRKPDFYPTFEIVFFCPSEQ